MHQLTEGSYFSPQDSAWEIKFGRILKIMTYIGIAALFIMVFITVRHAIGRYAVDSPVYGNAEVCCFMLAILIFMVGPYTQMMRGHIMVGLIVERFSLRVQAFIASAINIIVLVFLSLATWRTFDQARFQMEAGNVSSVLYVPYYPWLFLLTFGWAVFAIVVAVQVYHHIRTAIKGVEQ